MRDAEEREQEWAVIESDLAGFVPAQEIQRMKVLDCMPGLEMYVFCKFHLFCMGYNFLKKTRRHFGRITTSSASTGTC